MEPFIGQIMMFGGNFNPRGWALCDGQLLSISSNSALFSILGTTYGGDGRTTFGLPDLRGRVSMHPGNGPGLTPRRLGEKSGQEAVTLTTAQMPAHNHQVDCLNAEGDEAGPGANVPAGSKADGRGTVDNPYSANGDSTMKADMVGNTGDNQSHNNIQPYQCVNYIIALQGVFPSRN